jgi:hypothetical protein
MRSDIRVIVSLLSGNRGQTEQVNTAASQIDFRQLVYPCFPLIWWRIFKGVLIKYSTVIPVKAGIQQPPVANALDSGSPLRSGQNDDTPEIPW